MSALTLAIADPAVTKSHSFPLSLAFEDIALKECFWELQPYLKTVDKLLKASACGALSNFGESHQGWNTILDVTTPWFCWVPQR